jgi:hypothetical protein
MRIVRLTLLATVVCLAFLLPSCKSPATNTFTDGTYTGSFEQVLVIAGDAYTYTYMSITYSGTYTIDGDSVTFNRIATNGQTTFDFMSTTSSITLSNIRNFVNGGCGIAISPDVFTK